jgi:hypothetical protein
MSSLEKYLKYKNKYISLKNMTGGTNNYHTSDKSKLEFNQSQLSNILDIIRTAIYDMGLVILKIDEIRGKIRMLAKTLPEPSSHTQPTRNKYSSLTNMTGGKHHGLFDLHRQLLAAQLEQDKIITKISRANSQITEINSKFKEIADTLESPLQPPPVVTEARSPAQKRLDAQKQQEEETIMSTIKMNEIYHNSSSGSTPEWQAWRDAQDRRDRLERERIMPTPKIKLSDRAGRIIYS